MLPKLETIKLGEQIKCDMQLLQILQSKATERSNGFNFDLTTLDLSRATITAAEFNAIPQASKASIKELNLFRVDCTGFDFSDFTGLTTLDLSYSTITAAQFNAIPQASKASIKA
ncbi:hypothetical protein HOH45_06705, partial [bacterium]|nr:hypothetical protein [bacterium]